MPKKKLSPSNQEEDLSTQLLPPIINHEYKKFLKNKLFMTGLTFIFIISLTLISLIFFFSNRFYPGVKIAEINLSFQDYKSAETILTDQINNRLAKPLIFNYTPISSPSAKQQYTITVNPNMININKQDSIKKAYSFIHQSLSWPPPSIDLDITFNPSFDEEVNSISDSIEKPPIDSQISIDDSNQIIVTPSQEGLEVNKQALEKLIKNYINTGQLVDNNLPTKTILPKMSYQTGLLLKQRLDQIKLSPLKLKYKELSFDLDLPTIISFIDLEKSTPSLASGEVMDQNFNIDAISVGQSETTDSKISLRDPAVNLYFQNLSRNIDQEVQEPLFNFDPNSPNKVKEFRPPQEGRKLNLVQAREEIRESLLNPNQGIIELPVIVIEPKNKLANDLGIKELIGQGVSNFSHSIENRIFNLTLAASRVNGVLIAPGQEFSFNQTVGDISAATGYKQAYVIKSGKTVLDDGGGVCQVSTTIFRAALNAGVPITTRTAHAYRVSYYEQGFPPGMDATTYYPSVDLKFRNDTPAHILIQTRVEGYTMYVDFYGTSDGRISKTTTPVIVSQTPALPEIRQDDPTLPKGTVKQVDWAATGANVVFNRTVTRNGQTLIQETFRSNYRPWQAVYLVGTKEN